MNSHLVILFPKANTALMPQLERVLAGIKPAHSHRIHVAHVEDTLGSLAANQSLPPHLRVYASSLEEKYVRCPRSSD